MKEVLEVSALLLSIVNGLMLLRAYLLDRPILKIYPVHPDIYQWWFRLPNGEYEGQVTRRYGFLIYVAIDNYGLRKVAVNSWRLFIRNHKRRWRKVELKALNIPEPTIHMEGVGTKVLPVLGQRGPAYGGDLMVESGSGITGTAYYVAEFWGHEGYNPIIKGGKITGTLVVRNVLGGKAKKTIVFSEQSLEEVKKIIPNIVLIGLSAP